MHPRVGFLKPLVVGRKHRDRRLHLLRRSGRPRSVPDQMRAASLSVHRRPADHRQVLRHRRRRAVHHERRQPCDVRLFDLSLQHLRPWLGTGLRPVDLAARGARRHGGRQRCLDRHGGGDPARHRRSATAPSPRAKSVVTHDVPPYAIVAGESGQGGKDALRQAERSAACFGRRGGIGRSTRSARNLDAIRGTDIAALEAAV